MWRARRSLRGLRPGCHANVAGNGPRTIVDGGTEINPVELPNGLCP